MLIKDQAYDDYFYGKDGVLEKALGDIEKVASKVIADLLANNALPERLSEGFTTLHTFALFQTGRTPAAAAEMDEQVDKIAKELARDVPELKDSLDKVRISYANAPAAALKLSGSSC